MADHVKPIRVEGMAVPMGHYSHVVLAGDTLYISGVIAADQTGALVGVGDVATQSRRLFENLGTVLAAAGGKPSDVAKVTVFMRDVRERAKMNAARQDFFGDHRPASTLVEVAALVDPEVLIEVDAVAVVESRQSD